jgi:hypothetical protein
MHPQRLLPLAVGAIAALLFSPVESRSVRWAFGTPPSSQSAFCSPSLKLSKLSEKQIVAVSQFE